MFSLELISIRGYIINFSKARFLFAFIWEKILKRVDANNDFIHLEESLFLVKKNNLEKF